MLSYNLDLLIMNEAKLDDNFPNQNQPYGGFLRKSVLKISSKFTGKHPCRSVISIKLQSKFTEITLRHGCSPVNLLHIFRTPFLKNTSGGLFLSNDQFQIKCYKCLRKERKLYGGGLCLYINEVIPSKQIHTKLLERLMSTCIEMNSRKRKWLVIGSINLHSHAAKCS